MDLDIIQKLQISIKMKMNRKFNKNGKPYKKLGKRTKQKLAAQVYLASKESTLNYLIMKNSAIVK